MVNEGYRRPRTGSDCVSYGLSSGEGLIERVADDPIKDVPTNEPNHKPPIMMLVPRTKRLLCIETEFARPISCMKREGNTLGSILRVAWDGKTLEVMTRGKSAAKASNAYISIIAHITPDELSKLFAKATYDRDGFANRFLWCYVTSSRDLPDGGNIEVLSPFVERIRTVIANASNVGMMPLSADAETLRSSVYSTLKRSKTKVTERARPQVLRLAMAIALFDSNLTIELRHLKAALAVWNYCEQSAGMIFGSGKNLKIDPLPSRLLETVLERKRNETCRPMLFRLPDDMKTERFDKAVQTLLDRGDIYTFPFSMVVKRTTTIRLRKVSRYRKRLLTS